METGATDRTYWAIWGVLLLLTFLMIVFESFELSRVSTVLILTVAMMAKATMITGWFMHLRWERAALIAIVVGTITITAAFMFLLLIPDALGVPGAPTVGP